MQDKFSNKNFPSVKSNDKIEKKIWQRLLITYHVIGNFFLFFVIVGLFFLFFTFGIGAGYFASVVKNDPIRSNNDLRSAIMNFEQTSEIYFADDVYLGKMKTDLDFINRKLDQVSPLIQEALIATEDEHFFEHSGVVPKSIFRAIFQETTDSSIQSGGSTLTQQLIKMKILSSDQSFERKIREILLAQRIENKLTKEEILESYLNSATFGRNSSGRNVAGIQAASTGIFGINSDEVNLAQAAFLAGLPNSPSYFTPFTKSGELKEDLSPGLNRMRLVLYRMYQNGNISGEEYNAALEYDIVSDFQNTILNQTVKNDYPYIMDEVDKRVKKIIKPILAAQQGYSEEDLENNSELSSEFDIISSNALRQNNYKIYTTIDKDIYDVMAEEVKKFPHYQKDQIVKVKNPETGLMEWVEEPVEVGAILIDNKTGRIISFVGGRDFNREQVNHATSTLRSNGSTMKPLLIYGPAMEYGVSSPGKPLINVRVAIPQGGGTSYQPRNYGDGGYNGIVSTREAVKNSYNVPAILQYHQIIDKVPANYLLKMGFTSLSDEDFVNLSAGIGGIHRGVTVEENTNAYNTFANDGKFVNAYLIEKIVDVNGDVIYQHEHTETEVFTPQTAYMMREVLRDVVKSGTAAAVNSNLSFQSDWIGKTGTSQDYKDAWLVLSNPSVTFGTWMGYDTQGSLQKGGMSYSMRNLILWTSLINSTNSVKPEVLNQRQSFTTKEQTGKLVMASFDRITGATPSSETHSSGRVQTDVFHQNFLPSQLNSTTSQSYVLIQGKKYADLPETPPVFVRSNETLEINSLNDMGLKYVLNKEELSRLIGLNLTSGSNSSTVGEIAQHFAAYEAPEAVTSVWTEGNVISWSRSNSNNVVGYYVYKIVGETAVIDSIVLESENLVHTVTESGIYSICAVSIGGKLSVPSDPIYID